MARNVFNSHNRDNYITIYSYWPPEGFASNEPTVSGSSRRLVAKHFSEICRWRDLPTMNGESGNAGWAAGVVWDVPSVRSSAMCCDWACYQANVDSPIHSGSKVSCCCSVSDGLTSESLLQAVEIWRQKKSVLIEFTSAITVDLDFVKIIVTAAQAKIIEKSFTYCREKKENR